MNISKKGSNAYISEVTSERETRSLPKQIGHVVVDHIVCDLSVN